jgi:hypothetical protein
MLMLMLMRAAISRKLLKLLMLKLPVISMTPTLAF